MGMVVTTRYASQFAIIPRGSSREEVIMLNCFGWFRFYVFGGKSTVSGILRGSRNVDTMEQDIERFCRLTVWLLNDFSRERPDCIPETFRLADWYDLMYRHGDTGYYWQLVLSEGLPCGIRLWTESSESLFEYKHGRRTLQLKPCDVKDVHDKLESLREGIIRNFPFMNIQYDPYMKAR
jgi:hypothetical protein